jgi:hypothetical protein
MVNKLLISRYKYMSGVKRKAMAETRGMKQITNEDLKDDGIGTKSEQSEKYGEEKHGSTKEPALK